MKKTGDHLVEWSVFEISTKAIRRCCSSTKANEGTACTTAGSGEYGSVGCISPRIGLDFAAKLVRQNVVGILRISRTRLSLVNRRLLTGRGCALRNRFVLLRQRHRVLCKMSFCGVSGPLVVHRQFLRSASADIPSTR